MGSAPQAQRSDARVQSMLYEMRQALVNGETARADELESRLARYITSKEPGDPENSVYWEQYQLSKKERRLADVLNRHFGQFLTRETLMNAVYWDSPVDDYPETKILDIFSCKINKKLKGSALVIEADHQGGKRLTHRENIRVYKSGPSMRRDGYKPLGEIGWHGIRKGTRAAAIAELLGARLGEIFTPAEIEAGIPNTLFRAHVLISACKIALARENLYRIERVGTRRQGWRMVKVATAGGAGLSG